MQQFLRNLLWSIYAQVQHHLAYLYKRFLIHQLGLGQAGIKARQQALALTRQEWWDI